MRLVKLIYLSAPSTTQSWGTKITKKKRLGDQLEDETSAAVSKGRGHGHVGLF